MNKFISGILTLALIYSQGVSANEADSYLNGEELYFLGIALSGKSVDYPTAARIVDREFYRIENSFDKRERLNKLKPIIDQKFAYVKKHRHVQIHIKPPLEHYNFEHKGFPLDLSGRYSLNEGGRFIFINSKNVEYLNVPSEDKARQIETAIFKTPTSMVISAYAESATPESDHRFDRVNFQIDKVSLLDENGNVLLAQKVKRYTPPKPKEKKEPTAVMPFMF